MAEVKWKQHSLNLANACKDIHQKELYTDAKIVCGGSEFKTHRAILTGCSDFFSAILSDHPTHVEPLILVENVEPSFMQAILNYLYTGVITIDAMKAGSFLQVCTYLRIRGLMTYDIVAPNEEVAEIEVERATITTIEEPVIMPQGEEEDQEKLDDSDQDLLLFLHKSEMSSSPRKPTAGISYEIEAYDMEATTSEPAEMEELPETNTVVEYGPPSCPAEQSPKRGHRSRKTLPVPSPSCSTSTPPVAVSTSTSTTASSRKAPKSSRRTNSEGYTESTLNESMEAVCRGELNLSTAAHKFNVPKSVLWRKLQKRAEYVAHPENKRREAAKKALAKGEAIQEISKKFGVPMATLYRDKQKLIEEGVLGGQRKNKAEKEDALRQAVEACENGMAQSEAARMFQVSKATLWRKINAGK